MQKPDPIASIVLLGVLLVGAAFYVLLLRSENAELRARLARRAPTPAVAAAAPDPTPAVADAPVAPAAPTNTGPARLSDADRTAILARLANVTAPAKHAWLAFAPQDPGSVALHGDLVAVFRQAGWPVDSTPAPFPLRRGVYMFAADATPPAWVDDVLRALRDVGYEPTLGLDYRSYYEERKRTDPSWNGFALAPDQAFLLAIGPR